MVDGGRAGYAVRSVCHTHHRVGMTLGEAVNAYAQLTGEGITGLPVELRVLADRLTNAGVVVILDTVLRHRPRS